MKSKEKILLTQLQLLKHKRKRLKEESLRRINKSKRTQKKRKVVSDYYNILLDRGRQSRKFKVKQNVYTVSFHPFPQKSQNDFVRRILRDVLNQVKERMQCNPNDYLRLNIRHPSLESDIWYEFTQSKHLNEVKILNKIEAVQQSKKEFTITDGSAQFELFHVKYPQGSGGQSLKHLDSSKEKFKKGKQSVLKIVNPWDHLCLSRAIVVARLYSHKPQDPQALKEWQKQWNRMRKGDFRSVDQKQQAMELMRQAHCDPDMPCEPQEWNKLQEALIPQYRLKIFQFKTGCSRTKLEPLYKGKGHGTCLNILLDKQHYDTILSMPGVVCRNYYCDYCDVGYSHIEDHRTNCPHRCSFCLGDYLCMADGSSIHCDHCKGHFKNLSCYKRHLEPYSTKCETTVCSLMDRCPRC